MRQNDHEIIMQYYARLRTEGAKCEFHDTELEIKRHLQETVRNRKLANKSVRDRFSLEKFLEEAQADEEASANELEMTKETQDAGKQDSDANVNRVKEGKYCHRNANSNAVKLMEKPKRNPEVEKKAASVPLGDVCQNTSQRSARLLGKYSVNVIQRIISHVPVKAIKIQQRK